MAVLTSRQGGVFRHLGAIASVFCPCPHAGEVRGTFREGTGGRPCPEDAATVPAAIPILALAGQAVPSMNCAGLFRKGPLKGGRCRAASTLPSGAILAMLAMLGQALRVAPRGCGRGVDPALPLAFRPPAVAAVQSVGVFFSVAFFAGRPRLRGFALRASRRL